MNINEVQISSDKSRLDFAVVFNYLKQSYWAKNIPESVVKTSIEHSVCFGAYWHEQQIGFARLVTDQATFAYLADVFVLPEFNGNGVAQKMMRAIIDDDRFTGVRRFMLTTADAHSLYEKFGFTLLSEADQQKVMQVQLITGYSAS